MTDVGLVMSAAAIFSCWKSKNSIDGLIMEEYVSYFLIQLDVIKILIDRRAEQILISL